MVIVRSVVRCSVVRGICSSVNVVRGVVVLALWPEEWLWCICGSVYECCGVLWRFVYGVVVCVVFCD